MMRVVLSRYEVRDPIATGAMGTVYRGWDTDTQHPVAIKILHQNASEVDPVAIQRFLREGLIVSQLVHPHIVPVYATAEENDNYIMVMALVEGATLRDYIHSQTRLRVKRAVEIALVLADALAATHAINVVHRDLKPQNVLIATDGTPFLTDFGLALASDLESLTKSRDVLGTLPYICPETLRSQRADLRADMWSLGVLLYEMLVGELPFLSSSVGALIMEILQQPPHTELSAAREDCPPALVALVYQLLAKNPDDRPPTMHRVSTTLQSIRDGLGVGE